MKLSVAIGVIRRLIPVPPAQPTLPLRRALRTTDALVVEALPIAAASGRRALAKTTSRVNVRKHLQLHVVQRSTYLWKSSSATLSVRRRRQEAPAIELHNHTSLSKAVGLSQTFLSLDDFGGPSKSSPLLVDFLLLVGGMNNAVFMYQPGAGRTVVGLQRFGVFLYLGSLISSYVRGLVFISVSPSP